MKTDHMQGSKTSLEFSI